ncbi:MAG: MqnA/MqnD/SBP family protein [Acidilobus sp.]
MVRTVSSYHYYDPVHAYFLVYGLLNGVHKGNIALEPKYEEFDSLNRRVINARDLEVSAVSAVNLWRIADDYYVLTVGSTQRYDVGPVIVSKRPYRKEEISDLSIAVPGTSFSGYYYYRLFFRARDEVVIRYDKILEAVLKGEVDLGLLLPGPATTMAYERRGLVKVADIGEEWRRAAGELPIPLGSYVVNRRLLTREEAEEVKQAFREAIDFARRHPEEALAYATNFASGADAKSVREFIEGCKSIYDMGETGKRAIMKAIELGRQRGLVDYVPRLEFI